jgi:hypothetical protein
MWNGAHLASLAREIKMLAEFATARDLRARGAPSPPVDPGRGSYEYHPEAAVDIGTKREHTVETTF